MTASDKKKFWEVKSLAEMTPVEWETLCDGCAKCCLHKLEDDESGDVYICNVACRLLDLGTCQCQDYSHRQQQVPDCLVLSPEAFAQNTLEEFHWLPTTCAYRLIAEGKSLPEWHPLISGSKTSVLEAGISICGRVVSEDEADDLHLHITDWVL